MSGTTRWPPAAPLRTEPLFEVARSPALAQSAGAAAAVEISQQPYLQVPVDLLIDLAWHRIPTMRLVSAG